MIHLKRTWPFFETGQTREARLRLEQVKSNRPRVEALEQSLVERGRKNHFAESWAEALEWKKRDDN